MVGMYLYFPSRWISPLRRYFHYKNSEFFSNEARKFPVYFLPQRTISKRYLDDNRDYVYPETDEKLLMHALPVSK